MEFRTSNPPLILIEHRPGDGQVPLHSLWREVRLAFPESAVYGLNNAPEGAHAPAFSVLKEGDILSALRGLFQRHPQKSVLRIHAHGRLLPASLLRNFLGFHMDHGNRYSYTDLDEIAFYHTFLELFPLAIVPELDSLSHPTIPPDAVLNASSLARSGVMHLTPGDAGYFLRESFGTLFPHPVNLNVEISSVCNARCTMCHFDRDHGIGLVDDPPPFIPEPLFRKIVDEASSWDPKPTIDFCWRGEPLMNPKLLEHLSLGKEKGLPLLITTNGSLLTPELAERLLDLEISQLVFSIDGIIPRTYDSIRRGLRYESVKRNLEHLLEVRAGRTPSPRTHIAVKACLQEENEGEMEDLIHYWVRKVDCVVVQNKGIYDPITRQAYSYGVGHGTEGERSVCPNPFIMQSITATGRVYDCLLAYDSNDPHMGDCSATTLLDLWHGEMVGRKRKAMLECRFDRLPVCAGCRVSASMATVKKEIANGVAIQQKQFCTIYSRV